MVGSGWFILLPYVLSLADICSSFEIGGDDWSWPGSTWDGLAVGYGHPGWELPLSDFHTPLLELPGPLESSVVHNHYHHIVGGGGPYGGPGGPTPHEGLINGPLYQHFPTEHHHHPHHHKDHHHPHHHEGHHHPHHHEGEYHPTRDWYCHHAKKVKHLRKWLTKMLFCNLVY